MNPGVQLMEITSGDIVAQIVHLNQVKSKASLASYFTHGTHGNVYSVLIVLLGLKGNKHAFADFIITLYKAK